MGIQSDIADLAELKRLASACPPPGNLHFGSDELKAVTAFRDEVVRLFGWEVGMAQALIAENEALHKAVKFAAEAFETITSGDGSGHADLAAVVQRIAGGDSAGADVFRKDAERYRWLRVRLIGVLRDWDDKGKGMLGLSFKIPGEAWRSCDENIDAAMAGAGEL